MLKIILRSVTKSFSRFLAVVIIVALGAGFYSGMKATSPNMKYSLNQYLEDNNCYDVNVLCSEGIEHADVSSINKLDNVTNVKSAKVVDFIAELDNSRTSVRAHSYNFSSNDKNTTNKIDLVSGRYPNSSNECVVSLECMNLDSIDIGTKIKLQDNDTETNFYFNEKEFEVVGFVHSPLFIDKTFSGVTNIGDGQIYNPIFVTDDAFNASLSDNCAYIRCDNLDFMNTDCYYDSINKVKNDIEKLSTNNKKFNTFDRKDNEGINGYSEYVDRTNTLSSTFPFLFFVITILVVVATINRKVNEERQQIGTLKALGFSKKSITFLYILFSLIATIVGSVIGIAVFYNLIPALIIGIYNESYNICLQQLQYYPDIILTAVLIMIGIVLAVTLVSVIPVIQLACTTLMRPRMPKGGNHIFIEKISFLWNKFSYFSRVSLRNSIKFPGRLIMSFVGMTGCIVLVISSINLYVSSSEMVSRQYSEVFYENAISNVNFGYATADEQKKEIIKDVENTLSENSAIDDFVGINNQAATITGEDKGQIVEYQLNVEAASSYKELAKVKNFNNYYTGIAIDVNSVNKTSKGNSSNYCIITSGLAQNLHLNVGDEVRFNLIVGAGQNSENEYNVRVGAITTNYIWNYIYMDENCYRNVFNKACVNNSYLLTTNVSESYNAQQISNDLYKNENISYVKFYEKEIETYNQIVRSMYLISIVLCCVAAILTFVVLFSITEINIAERKREIATLKVLGFPNSITDTYIHRETLFHFIISAVVGCILGTFFSIEVLNAIKGYTMMFDENIKFIVYAVSIAFSFVVVVLSIVILSRKTRHLNLVENIKSVD